MERANQGSESLDNMAVKSSAISDPMPSNSISIIIPTYNRARLVVEAVESALAQKDKDTEVVVVDDGSTDGTEQVLKMFEGRILYVRKENGGVSSARNAGVQAGCGEWLVFLDDDDQLLPGRIAEIRKAIALHPDAVGHMFDAFLEIDNAIVRLFDLRRIVLRSEVEVCKQPLEYVLRQCCFAWNVAVRREAFERVGGFSTEAVHEDWDFLSKCACLGTWTVIAKPLIMVRRIANVANLSDRTRANKIKALLSLAKSHETLLQGWCHAPEERRKVLISLASVWKGVAIQAARENNPTTWQLAIARVLASEPRRCKRYVAHMERLCGFAFCKLWWGIKYKKRKRGIR